MTEGHTLPRSGRLRGVEADTAGGGGVAEARAGAWGAGSLKVAKQGPFRQRTRPDDPPWRWISPIRCVKDMLRIG